MIEGAVIDTTGVVTEAGVVTTTADELSTYDHSRAHVIAGKVAVQAAWITRF